jgi:glycosyltransferase involved in cell wall biosynthesis
MLDRAIVPARLPPPNLLAGTKRIRVCFVGRLSNQKRPFLVLETMRALQRLGARQGIAVALTILGDGPFLEPLRDLMSKRGMTGMIRFLPPDADVAALLAESDFLILPSANEGLALVLYEAAQNGCFPISCDVGAQAEILPDALRVPSAPAGALRGICRVITTLTQDPATLAATHAELQKKWDNVLADQTAAEVLMPVYLAAAKRVG